MCPTLYQVKISALTRLHLKVSAVSLSQSHKRFLDIVRKKIKTNFKEYISSDQFVAKKGSDFVKISIPTVSIPKLKYGFNKQNSSKAGAEGDSQAQANSSQKGKTQAQAGKESSDHIMDVEVSFDDLAEILREELKLPRIEPKGSKNVKTDSKKYNTRSLEGSQSLRHTKESYKQALKRSILSDSYNFQEPQIVPEKRDFRFKSYKRQQKPKSNVAVIYIMDVSGSMGDEQKEIVRIESFWLNTWLKKNYQDIETRFIIHDAQAKEVDEKTFFSTSESGGTLISSSYKLCRDIIEKDYPVSNWNIYPFHFSDGDNWSGEDTRFCLKILKEYFLKRVNMFGYAQVESKYGSGQFAKDLEKEFKEEEKIIISRIESKDKIVNSIRDFFKKGY